MRPDRSARPSRGHIVGLLAVISGGVTLLVAGAAVGPAPDPLVRLLGASLCVYAGMLVLSWYPMPPVARQVERFFEGVLDRSQAGWYVVVAMAHFARAELSSLWERGTSGLESGQSPWHWLVTQLWGFSLDTLMSGLWAGLWPLKSVQEFGILATAAFMGLVYGLYQVGVRTLGEPHLRLSAGDEPGLEQAEPPAARPHGNPSTPTARPDDSGEPAAR